MWEEGGLNCKRAVAVRFILDWPGNARHGAPRIPARFQLIPDQPEVLLRETFSRSDALSSLAEAERVNKILAARASALARRPRDQKSLHFVWAEFARAARGFHRQGSCSEPQRIAASVSRAVRALHNALLAPGDCRERARLRGKRSAHPQSGRAQARQGQDVNSAHRRHACFPSMSMRYRDPDRVLRLINADVQLFVTLVRRGRRADCGRRKSSGTMRIEGGRFSLSIGRARNAALARMPGSLSRWYTLL